MSEPNREDEPAKPVFVEDEQLGSLPKPNDDQVIEREHTRKTIALILVWTFAGVVAICFLIALLGACIACFDKAYVLEMLKVLLPPVVALVGTVTGFYYGSHSK